MPRDRARDPLFLVDNSPEGLSVADYLRRWSEVAESVDIASGYFEIGALLELDGAWQQFAPIRLLMGDEVTGRTKKELLASLKDRAVKGLDSSLEETKEANPFLVGVEAIRQALASDPRQLDVRVYNKDKFHAKAYISKSRFEGIGEQALVGSSNFTAPGLTQNLELNISLRVPSEVAQLQDWFDEHWKEGVEISEELLKVVERHCREFSPFEVYARSLQALVAKHEMADSTWETRHSKMFSKLDRYQQEGYWALLDIADKHGGALLCDGVGLGKTFVGLMLIEHFISLRKQRVVIFAPKAVNDAVWKEDLKTHLPHLGGVDEEEVFSNLAVLNHTDLSRPSEAYQDKIRRITELADVVLIDEAHHFRNRGRLGTEDDPQRHSRYRRLFDLIGTDDNGRAAKKVFMLTATPINNSLRDFKNLLGLFDRDNDGHFATTVEEVQSVDAHIRNLTKQLQGVIGDGEDLSANIQAASDALDDSPLFKELVVQRSRRYARKSQLLHGGDAAVFPEREAPKVAAYSLDGSAAKLLEKIASSFKKEEPLFWLSIYYPLRHLRDVSNVNPVEQNRQKQVVGLIRTNFLKRFDSSVFAFERSCDRLLRKLVAFLELNSETDSEKDRLAKWKQRHAQLLDYATNRQHHYWGTEADDPDADDDVVPQEILDAAEVLDREEYKVEDIIHEAYNDLEQVVELLKVCEESSPAEDDKVGTLVELIGAEQEQGRKVVVFTEFADTARYIRRCLADAGVERIAQLDSSTKVDRKELIKRFAPYYNKSSSPELKEAGLSEVDILITTDVLAEGLNLQDATRLVNYDIHWNPVRLMQRIGRVDRRLNPEVEDTIKADHPERASERGQVVFWNFLPPDDLDRLLKLYNKLHKKVLQISATLGLEQKQLLDDSTEYDPLKEFNAAYEGTETEDEKLRLEYDKLVNDTPGLAEALRDLPSGIFSSRDGCAFGRGVFFCFELPSRSAETGEYSLEHGPTRWYLHIPSEGLTVEDPGKIIDWLRCEPETPQAESFDREDLLKAKAKVEKHIRDGYLKSIEAPLRPAPRLIGWLGIGDV